VISSDQQGTVGSDRQDDEVRSSQPIERCPWPRPFPADFDACRAYQPADFVVADSLNRALGSERTCHHLGVGSSGNGHGPRYYPRCALGDNAARHGWLAAVRPERAAVRRALREDFDRETRADRERLFAATARAGAAPGSAAERAELESAREAMRERARRFVAEHAEQIADAGQAAAPLFGVLDHWAAPTAAPDGDGQLGSHADEVWLTGRTVVVDGDGASGDPGNLESLVSVGSMEVMRRRRPPGLLVSGEIDTTNADALGHTLAAELAGSDEVHLDLGAVLFCDLGGVRAIVRAAQSAGDGHRVVMHGMPIHLRRALRVAGWGELPCVVVAGEGAA